MKTRTTVINGSDTAKIIESIRVQSTERLEMLRVANNTIKDKNIELYYKNKELKKEIQSLREQLCKTNAELVDTKNHLFVATQCLSAPQIVGMEEFFDKVDDTIKAQKDDAYETAMDVVYKGD